MKLIETGNWASSLSSKVDGRVSSKSLSSVKSESSSKRFCKCAAVGLVSALIMKLVAYGKMTIQAATGNLIFASVFEPVYQAAVFILNENPRVKI